MQDDDSKAELPAHLDPEKVFAGKSNAVAGVAAAVPDEFKGMLKAIGDDGLRIGSGIGNGGAAHSAKWHGVGDGSEIPRGVIRIDAPEYSSLHKGNPIVLQPAYRKTYASGLGDYELVIVPYAPDPKDMVYAWRDIKDPPAIPEREDVLRTLRILKRMKVEGDTCSIASDDEVQRPDTNTAFNHVKDFQTDQFVFIRSPEMGDYIRYPGNTDPEFAGQKIAFIRDLNSITVDKDTGKAFGDAAVHNLPTDLAPAPPECAAACAQQYERTRKLAEDLRAAGIEPNVPISDVASPTNVTIIGAHQATGAVQGQVHE